MRNRHVGHPKFLFPTKVWATRHPKFLSHLVSGPAAHPPTESRKRYKVLEKVARGRCIEPVITARCATDVVTRYAACSYDSPRAVDVQEIGTA